MAIPAAPVAPLSSPMKCMTLTTFHDIGRAKPSLYLRSQNENQADPILFLSEKWMDLASTSVCLTNFSIYLKKLQKAQT